MSWQERRCPEHSGEQAEKNPLLMDGDRKYFHTFKTVIRGVKKTKQVKKIGRCEW